MSRRGRLPDYDDDLSNDMCVIIFSVSSRKLIKDVLETNKTYWKNH